MRGGCLLSLALALAFAACCVAGHGEHPLSRIAIHRARVALDASAAVRASPNLLGSRGEDTAWVTVDFNVPHASDDDWIGVFSPSNFNASTCPGSQGSGPGPAICSAPIKYQFANYSSGYAESGKRTLKFQLINQRQDFSFGLFTGGLSNPTLVAVSNKIAFANPKAPVYPRLALGKTWNEMTVTWTSGYSVGEAYPFVEWGMKGSPPVRTAAATVTFGRERLCGEPARTVGWRDPGFIHTSFLQNLWPDKEYYYRIGHVLHDGKVIWGKPKSFTAPPYPGQKSLQRVVIFGDMGKTERDGSNEYQNYQPASLNTTDTLIKDLDNTDIGEDTAWVTVDFHVPHASGEDWIGVFSPSNFNASTCPASQGSDPAPSICSAPIKYQFTNYSSGYSESGKGSLKFQLINQRQDFSFGLFTGGLSNPTLVAVSNKIAFANPKAPVYPRLALGKTWNEMTVTWTSGYSIGEAYPFVEWGMKGSPPVRKAAATVTFGRERLCGEPARTVGWRDPGFIHTAFLQNLWPDKEYYYKIGHTLHNGKIIWGKPKSFTAPPYPGQKSLQRVVIFGDMGKAERDGSNEYQNYQLASLNTTDALIRDLDNTDIVFHIGDIAYANGYLSQWDQFTQQVEPITSQVPYMVASGNHERDFPNSGSFYNGTDSGGECGALAETMYYAPTENRGNYWYSTDYGMFRFCVADSEQDWREGTEQYKFIEHCLATVDRAKQPWLVFIAHRVLGYSSGFSYGYNGAFAEPMARQSLEPLWRRHRVDVAFYGHVHQYERTCPVYEEKCVRAGTVHVVVGGGGSHLTNFTTEVPPWSVYREMDYGFGKLTAMDDSLLKFEYRRSSDGKVYDSFTVHKDK